MHIIHVREGKWEEHLDFFLNYIIIILSNENSKSER